MGTTDPTPAHGREELVNALKELHELAGQPSARSLARSLDDVSHTTVADALSGRRVPSWQILAKLVGALAQGQADVERRFRRLWLAAQGVKSERPSFGYRSDGPLVGRAAVLADIQSILRGAGPDGAAGVFVTGESGVGKSRLLRETADALHASGFAVLFGACLDIGDAMPLHPVLRALRRHDEDSPALAVTADDADALLAQVTRDLRVIAGDQRLLLVLDDLQWADRSTRRLLLYLLAGLGDIRVSVLAAIRAEALHGTHPLRRVLAELRRLPAIRVLDLQPLSRDDTRTLVGTIVGDDVAVADADSVYKRSGGNPFVAEELAGALRDRRTELSDTLREVFLSRLGALPSNAHVLVNAIAAGVEPVEHDVLAQVVPLPEDLFIDAIRTAIAYRFVDSDGTGYRLRHRLVAEVLAREVLPAEAAALHRRYAEALERQDGEHDPARLAFHWQRAGEPSRALPAVIAAARAAERLYGFDEAHKFWTTALELTDAGHPQRGELLERAAESAHQCGEHILALTRLEDLAGRDDAPGQVDMHLRRARYLAAAGRPRPAEVEYQRALEALDCTPRQRASAAAFLAELLLHLGRYADAHQRAREALELAATNGSTADIVRASAARGFSAAFRGDPDEGLAVIRQAVEIAERSGHPEDLGVAYLYLAELLTGPLNSVEEGVLVARRGAERLTRLGAGRAYQTRLLAIAGNGLFRIGQWAESDEVLDTAIRLRPSGAAAVEVLLARCRLWVGFGDVSNARRDLDAVATLLADGGARHVLPMLTLRAGLAIWQGEYADARAAIQRGLTETRSDDLVLLGVLAWHGLRVEADAHAAGQPVDASALGRLNGVRDRLARPLSDVGALREVVGGYLDLCAGELGRIEDSHDPAPWARAAASWDRRQHPYAAAYARLRHAEVLLRRKVRRSVAVTGLRQAYATAAAMGARPLAGEIRAVAQRYRVSLAHGAVSVPPAALSGPAGELAVLTERELEVLAAVAEGLTNREIGEALFISERTVGVYLGRIFDKLQVRSRVQASRVYLTAS
ncbi:LuxR C-terminal-related transcriptional regulator [Actinoplanes sp. NEAU-A12]|uniref:LuxR C-terminal-related transcriptional regulator n=1 Tax=Actinoplanes sandaracinus TaxID=3045177 RepID=A0ABT6WGX6_9ACTN|nr:LuxR family transcriptional regulator [Actinoplanes sandaracinus]MDI6098985.1 LuxR C-terminal-related transcriptional regulator [Actinoplanes sandaracinus]